MDHLNLGRLCLAALAAGVAGSITDWFFFGMLFHDKYLIHPEVWDKRAEGPTRQIVMSSVVGLFASTAFIFLCGGVWIEELRSAIKLAIAVWMIAAVPVLANDHIFIKLHRALFASHSIGWLVRFLLAAVAYIYIGR